MGNKFTFFFIFSKMKFFTLLPIAIYLLKVDAGWNDSVECPLTGDWANDTDCVNSCFKNWYEQGQCQTEKILGTDNQYTYKSRCCCKSWGPSNCVWKDSFRYH